MAKHPASRTSWTPPPFRRLQPTGTEPRTDSRWDRDLIDRGTRLIEQALPSGPVGSFQLQAAIAAVHAEAATSDATDWPQIVEPYRMLDGIAPSPVVSLDLAVVIGMSEGAPAGLDALRPLLDDPRRQRNHRVHAAHAHLLAITGDTGVAVSTFRCAATLTDSIPEQRYLNRRAGSFGFEPGASV